MTFILRPLPCNYYCLLQIAFCPNLYCRKFTFPIPIAAARLRLLTGTKLYCLVTGAQGSEQLAQSRTRPRPDRKSNPRRLDRKCDAQRTRRVTTSPRHHLTRDPWSPVVCKGWGRLCRKKRMKRSSVSAWIADGMMIVACLLVTLQTCCTMHVDAAAVDRAKRSADSARSSGTSTGTIQGQRGTTRNERGCRRHRSPGRCVPPSSVVQCSGCSRSNGRYALPVFTGRVRGP